MAEKIRLMIVDDIERTRNNLRQLLELEDDITVIGEAADGAEALIKAKQVRPDIVLMDISMPGMDGVQASEIMTVELPQTGIIILSAQDETEYLRKTMAAGAREYLTKPPSREEMLRAIHRIYDLEKKRRVNQETLYNPEFEPSKNSGKVISIFSSKGGVGKSTIAVNLAVAIARLSGKKTMVVDLNLQFGDVAMLFDLPPGRTISDLVREPDYLEPEIIENYLSKHASGVKILPAPLRPEFAEVVEGKQIEGILQVLKEHYDYIIIDNHQAIDDQTLIAFDSSDLILMVVALDVLTVKNTKLAMETLRSIHYDAGNIKLILNYAAGIGLSPRELEAGLNFPVYYSIPSEAKIGPASCNQGIPFVIHAPKAPISKAILGLGRELIKELGERQEAIGKRK